MGRIKSNLIFSFVGFSSFYSFQSSCFRILSIHVFIRSRSCFPSIVLSMIRMTTTKKNDIEFNKKRDLHCSSLDFGDLATILKHRKLASDKRVHSPSIITSATSQPNQPMQFTRMPVNVQSMSGLSRFSSYKADDANARTQTRLSAAQLTHIEQRSLATETRSKSMSVCSRAFVRNRSL
jgi:hypothetical protein